MKKATIEEKGIKATVYIDDYEDDEDYVTVSLIVEPPARGINKLAYQRIQKIPKKVSKSRRR